MAGAAPSREIEFLDVDAIEVHGERRSVSADAVSTLAASMERLGLRTPISVRYYEDRPDQFKPGDTDDAIVLIAGRHRLEAARQLGWEKIECVVYHEGDEVDVELWEIAENLHRADLSQLERKDQEGRYLALAAQRDKERGFVQTLNETPSPRGGRPEGGVSKAARDLGLTKTRAWQAEQIHGMSAEAKEVAKETGLDRNTEILVQAARADDGVAFLRAEHARREAERERKEAEKHNRDAGRVIQMSDAERFAEWLGRNAHPSEIPQVISWLEGCKPRDVILSLRKAAA